MADMGSLLALMARLRDPESGCPWDREQSFASIAPHTLEEAYEVIDVIERQQWSRLPDELGDLLFQIVFYAQLGTEKGWFSFETVVDCIHSKLIERHPHVFTGMEMASAEEQSRRWEDMKAEQRQSEGATGALDGVALALPALIRAAKLQRRAARIGFDWPDVEPVYAKLDEELRELRVAPNAGEKEAELGDLLFACVNLARHLNVEPERALRGANQRFENRFRYIEQRLREQNRSTQDASLAELDALWEEAKVVERGAK
jgi:ATP diphosphatase